MSRILAIVLLLLFPSFGAMADEAAERDAISRDVRRAFQQGDYAQLDEWADRYRDTQERTGSGQWKLIVFYGTFAAPGYILGKPNGEFDLATIDAVLARVDQWIAARPSSVAALIVKAQTLHNRAWHIRGDQFIHAVSKQALQDYLAANRKTYEYLQEVRPRAARDPDWYTVMLSVLLGPGLHAEFDAVAAEALEYHPGYYNIHYVIMRRHYPQWGGTRESLDKAADQIAAAAETVGEGDTAYARAYWAVVGDLQRNEFYPIGNAWPRMKRGFEQLAAAYPTTWNLNHFAWLACIAGDKPATAGLLHRIGKDIVRSVWGYDDMPSACREMAAQPDTPRPAELDRLPAMIIVAGFDRDENGRLQPSFEPVIVATVEAAVEQAKGLAGRHDGIIAWRLEPPDRHNRMPPPEVLYSDGDVPAFDEMKGLKPPPKP